MSLGERLLACTEFPERFAEGGDGLLSLSFAVGGNKGLFGRKTISYQCQVRIDDQARRVLFREVVKEKGTGLSSIDESASFGFHFKKESYRVSGGGRQGSVSESFSVPGGEGSSYSFDYGSVREFVRKTAEDEGYAFSVVLKGSSLGAQAGQERSGTTPDAARSGARPSGFWYLLPLFVFLAAGVTAVIALVVGIVGETGNFQRMVMPRSYFVVLDEPGRYVIFYECRSTVRGRSYVTAPQISGMRVAVASRATGEQVLLAVPNVTQSYKSSVSGVSVLEFDITRPGQYQVSAWYAANQGPEVVLALGRGLGHGLRKTLGSAAAFLAVGVFLGAVIFLAVFLKRRTGGRSYEVLPGVTSGPIDPH